MNEKDIFNRILSLFIDSTLASRLNIGSLTILSYCSQISNLVNSIIIGSLLLYIYPRIVSKIATQNYLEYFWKQVSFFHLIVCLLFIGFYSVGKNSLNLLLGHGVFSKDAIYSVFLGTMLYIIGQQSNVVRDLIYRLFYSKGNTKVVAVNSFIVTIVNIVTNILY